MSSSPPSRPLPRPSREENDSILLSPLMTLMPTGYRNIQPFQKGKGWHTNGTHRVAATQASNDRDMDQHSEKERGVVFPLLPGHGYARQGTPGPNASAVKGTSVVSSGALVDDRQEKDDVAVLLSPRAPSTPLTNGAPRRPSRTENTGGSFRSRAFAGSPSTGSRPTSPATVTNNEENSKMRAKEEVTAIPGPDPVIMQQLWQEYAARSHAANRQVDAATYHEKMHRRYGEQRALKERIAQLEQALQSMEYERDAARVETESATKQLQLLAHNRSTSELSESTATSLTMRNGRSSFSKPTPVAELDNPEERSYRERSFALERALAQTKVSLSALQDQLQKQTAETEERTQALEAQLVLERNTSLELARQLREISAGFTRASAELVETRVTLEREQQRSQEIMDQARLQNAQLLSDSRRAQLETRMKLAVRSLGREALRHKMEALMSRTMRAEQSMRVAQLETERVCRERDATREQLEQVLSSHALKYHSLGAAGGIPGILSRSTRLSNSSRMVTDQLLLLQVLYEETEEPEDPDDTFCVHFVAYEPRSAQDDFLTFRLRDIERLVMNHDSFLARHSVRRRERLEALAELLLTHVHAGYKNGHLVLAETSGPEAATRLPREQLMAQQEQQHTHKVTVYRGTRYLPLVGAGEDDAVLAELDVTEAFAASTSQVWWLDIRAVVLGCEGCWDSESLSSKVDLRQLLTFCATFASYRPSENHANGNNDDAELFAVHEALLEPLFNNLRVVLAEPGGAARLEVATEMESRPPSGIEPQNQRRILSVEKQYEINREMLEEKEDTMPRTTSVSSTLTHQCVVNVGDVFYCVRLQELWDGELLLDITMDDPETQQHFHCVLHEPQLAKLAERLVHDGAIDVAEDDEHGTREDREGAVLQVKYGLAPQLHRPLCKLVERYVHPVLPHPSQVSNKVVTDAGDISLGTLFNDKAPQEEANEYEMRSMVLDLDLRVSLGWRYDREIRVIATQNVLTDERAVRQVLQSLLVASPQTGVDFSINRQRYGVHFRGDAGFALVQTVSANLPIYGHVAMFDVLSLSTEVGSSSYLPLVLVVEDSSIEDPPLQQVFDTLGLEEDTAEFTTSVFASDRRGSRAGDRISRK